MEISMDKDVIAPFVDHKFCSAAPLGLLWLKGPCPLPPQPCHVPARQWTRTMAQKGKLTLYGQSWA